MKKDNIFAHKNDPVSAFEFNEEVTSVFDDMIKRSVPLYMESLKRQCQFISKFYKTGTAIYDLGCSHGNLGVMVANEFKERDYCMFAVDSSPSMVAKYGSRLEEIKRVNHPSTASNLNRSITLITSLAEDVPILNASVVVVNLTMQFINPLKRDRFIQGIYDGLIDNGALLLSEKVSNQNMTISEIEQDFYKQFKLENGYSELEISRKREALENILIPETIESHINRLNRVGFKTVDVWLKWFNFASIVAIK
ncbi:MAG: carboxy-S-adenosyl-L-methionine synthase CmoA [Desulfamplus sp.]|nr:carboxy-S-adenosyl-L-methionine synthase CmoA [Desulfamplus sp.]